MAKIRRNEICPLCDSGLKYKKCCGNPLNDKPILKKLNEIPQEIKTAFSKSRADELIRERQQGLGHPIVSFFSNGYRVIAVGNKLHYSKKWKTFHDFLFDYIKEFIGGKWGNSQIKKPYEKRHPILQWYDQVCRYQKEFIVEPGKIASAPMIGAVEAYMKLAYNLYLIAHNTKKNEFNDKILKKLTKDLRNIESFPGYYYESYVYAFLILSGFEIEFEDQSGKIGKRCECVVTHKRSKNKFSVEAKSIRRYGVLGAEKNFTKKSLEASVRDQLYKALEKTSDYPRIIFIDVNLPNLTPERIPDWFDIVSKTIKNAENITINGKQSDSAYIIITNTPHHYHESETFSGMGAIVLGYKLNDFGDGIEYKSLRDAHKARKKYESIYDIIDSIENHYHIPSTFDGKPPTLAFNDNYKSTIVGQKYCFEGAGKEGEDLEAIVTSVCVNEAEKTLYIGTNIGSIIRRTMSKEEIEDYKKFGNAMFGEPVKPKKQLKDTYDLFVWLLETYSKTPKEKLLEFMSETSNIEELKKLPQEDLAEIYCERHAIAINAKQKK